MDEESIFAAALAKQSPQDRQAFLDTACGGDPQLRSAVESLLKSHDDAGSFLDTPAVEELRQGDIDATQAQPEAVDDLSLAFLSPPEKPGQLGRLDHYEILEVIGRGGMGVVLKAFDERLHRMVAVKVMAPQLASSASARKRFVREAQAAAAVRDEHVVGIHAVAEANGLPYLAMEYIAGVSLQERIDRGGPLAVKEVLRIGMQTAAGLAAAHAQGLIHRDIKPSNILLENGVERVRISDFGLARAVDDASLTQSGLIAGTPQYMAPEQAKGEAVDHRADLFSLGSVLYAMCTGRAPFRAETTMAVLKRVCEDTPRPIRDVHPETPGWLIAIIEKLHAKDPAKRFQTAAEVSELLGQHLAHLQQPSLTPMPAAVSPIAPRGRGDEGRSLLPSPLAGEGSGVRGRRRWAVAAAAVLLLLIGGLGLTEATGVTQVVPTVIRIVTGEGTLVVEVDDPGIQVSIEGDGGIVITGAGPQEVRLRPGSYQVRAIKDGKPLQEELVTITRGGKQVVKVRLEADSPATAQPAAKPEPQAFVVLGGQDVPERNFGTLAEAVEGASDGDTIEIRGNGPFASQPFSNNQALTIRAGDGFRPVIRFDAEGFEGSTALCKPYAPLVLEGLDLQLVSPEKPSPQGYLLIYVTTDAPLSIVNCRLLADASSLCIWAGQPSALVPLRIEIRNSEMFNSWSLGPIVHEGFRTQRLVLENCLLRGNQPLVTVLYNSEAVAASIRLTRNTFVSAGPSLSCWALRRLDLDKGGEVKPITLEASENVFDSQAGLFRFDQAEQLVANPLPLPEAKALLQQVLGWRERGNLYPVANSLLTWTVEPPPELAEVTTLGELKTLEEWNSFWGQTETSSQVGQPLYEGAHGKPLDRLTPEDFRLRSDSPGYHAGEDGRDLGADMDLVGPGPAYERWKKTPEYQQWRVDTGQVKKAEALQPEPKAFVVLGGEGVEVRKYDTLAEAVRGASDGDTIEVCGDGPFVGQPMSNNQALTIRAGEGFRPVIRFDADGLEADAALFKPYAPLVLEGLDLGLVSAAKPSPPCYILIHVTTDAPLSIANCRLLADASSIGIWAAEPSAPVPLRIEIRNSEMFNPYGYGPIVHEGFRTQRLVLENCLVRGQNPFIAVLYNTEATAASIRLTRNTFVSAGPSLNFWLMRRLDLDKVGEVKPITLEASENVFDSQAGLFRFDQGEQLVADPLPLPEAKALLQQLLGWRERGNLYPVANSLLTWTVAPSPELQEVTTLGELKTLEEWNGFWGQTETSSRQGQPLYKGAHGKPLDRLTPEDFRLRPDSPGYHAGEDGRDLGADIDLVGPGPAYERWKKTPEYQQWRVDTGQVKVAVPPAELQAFVVLGGQDVAERKFGNLAEAVQGASDGDTIEVRGNGPFVTEPIQIKSALTIRAGEGFRPVINLTVPSGAQAPPTKVRLDTVAPLVLEGLEFRLVGDVRNYDVVVMASTALHVANCRFQSTNATCINSNNVSPLSVVWEVRNCEFLCSKDGWAIRKNNLSSGHKLILENCVSTTRGFSVSGGALEPKEPSLRLTRNTFRTNVCTVEFKDEIDKARDFNNANQRGNVLLVEASGNVFDSSRVLVFAQYPTGRILSPGDAERYLAQVVGWQGERNLYAVDGQFVSLYLDEKGLHEPANPVKSLADWRQFWGTDEADSIEGRVRYQGGDLLSRVDLAPDQLTPEDFRLCPDSAGYRAGPDGKDLGADVDLVGPGPAYERWKQTPEYQQWLKETGQSK